jgi:hypothetical protein
MSSDSAPRAEREREHIAGGTGARTPESRPRTPDPGSRNDLAAALRRLTDLAVGRSLPDAAVAAAARELGGIADRLSRAAASGKAPRTMPDQSGPPQDYFPTSPMTGFASPLAPPLEVWAVRVPGDWSTPTPEGQQAYELRGKVTFGYAYEGPPTCVHGGVIAELFDELLGTTALLTAQPGMTARLDVSYRQPTPILTPLDLEAWCDRVDGRKVYMKGAIRLDGEVTAEAEGLFIVAGPKRMLDIAARHAERSEDAVMDAGLEAALGSERGAAPAGGDASDGQAPPARAQMARSRPSQ